MSKSNLERAAEILALDMSEPPEECFHGFALPRDCPNDKCYDRAVEWAWYVGRGADPGFELREVDVEAIRNDRRF